jgi:hypothetical protein
VCAAIVIAAALPARAQDGADAAPSLNWVRMEGADGCISPRELALAVEKRLGHEIFVSSAEAELALEGYIGPRPRGGWRATLTVSDREGRVLGSRDLDSDGDDCRELDPALALVIAVTIYPQSGLGGSAIPLPEDVAARLDKLFNPETTVVPRTRAGSAPTTPASVVEPRRSAAGSEAPAVRTEADGGEWTWGISFSTGVGLGMTPVPSPGVGLALHLGSPDAWSLEFRATYWVGGSESVDDDLLDPSAAIDVSAMAFNLGACPLNTGDGSVGLRLCAGISGGALVATSEGFSQNDLNPLSPQGGLYTGADLIWQFFDPLSVWLGAMMEIPLFKQELTYRVRPAGEEERESDFFVQEPVTGRIEIGLGIDFL